MILTRPARPGDEGAMCDILNALIAAGGTTAHQRPFDAARMRRHYLAPPGSIACTVAEVEGQVAAFQSLAWANDPDDPLPEGWASIATFATDWPECSVASTIARRSARVRRVRVPVLAARTTAARSLLLFSVPIPTASAPQRRFV